MNFDFKAWWKDSSSSTAAASEATSVTVDSGTGVSVAAFVVSACANDLDALNDSTPIKARIVTNFFMV